MPGEFPQARPGVVPARHCSCGSSTCIHIRRGNSPAGQTSVCVFAGFTASSGRVLGEFPQARPGVVLASHCSCGSSTCIHVRRGNSPAGQTAVCVFAGFAASSGQVLGEFPQARPGVVLASHCSCGSSTCIHVRCRNSPVGQTSVCVFAGFAASSERVLGEFPQARPGVVLARHCSCGSSTCIHVRCRYSPAGQTPVCVFAGFTASSERVLGEFPQARPGVVLARHCSCGSSTCIHVRRGNSPAGQTPVCVFAGFAASSETGAWGISAGQARCSPSQPLQLQFQYMHSRPPRNFPGGSNVSVRVCLICGIIRPGAWGVYAGQARCSPSQTLQLRF